MKQRSNSSAKKRFRKTGTGKLVATKSSKNHLLKNKSSRQKKLFNKSRHMPVHDTKYRQVYELLPYIK